MHIDPIQLEDTQLARMAACRLAAVNGTVHLIIRVDGHFECARTVRQRLHKAHRRRGHGGRGLGERVVSLVGVTVFDFVYRPVTAATLSPLLFGTVLTTLAFGDGQGLLASIVILKLGQLGA